MRRLQQSHKKKLLKQESEEVVTEASTRASQGDEEITESQIQQTTAQVTSQTTEDRILNITGSEVFIKYVRDYFREEFEQNRLEGQTLDDYIAIKMPPIKSFSLELQGTWQEKINHYAQHWNALSAYALLDFLEKDIRIAPLYIVKALRYVSFFATSYEPFLARVNVYREYLTNDEIKRIIEKKGLHFLGSENLKI